jgi:hypothetical protein
VARDRSLGEPLAGEEVLDGIDEEAEGSLEVGPARGERGRGRVAEAGEIERDDAAAAGEPGEQREPRGGGLAAAVEEDERRAVAALEEAERHLERGPAPGGERRRAGRELGEEGGLDRARAGDEGMHVRHGAEA